MATLDPVYRLTVYDDFTKATPLSPIAGAVHSDTFQIATEDIGSPWTPYMGMPEGSRGEIDPLDKRTTTGQLQVGVLDRRTTTGGTNLQRWLTAFLGDDAGRSRILGLPVLIELSTDGATSWEDFYSGFVEGIGTDGRVWLGLTVRDPAERLNTDVFVGTPAADLDYAFVAPLWPVGLVENFGPIQTVPRPPGVVEQAPSGGIHAIKIDTLGRLEGDALSRFQRHNAITAQLHERALSAGEADNPNINPTLRVECRVTSGARAGESGEFAVRRLSGAGYTDFIWLTENGNWFHVAPSSSPNRWGLIRVGIAELDASDPAHMAIDADLVDAECEFWVVPYGEEPTEDTPLFIDDVHPVQLWKDMLDGKYSALEADGTSQFEIDYVAAEFDALIADETWPDLRFIIREGWAMNDFVEEQILKPCQLAYSVNASGALEPVDMRTPSDVGGLLSVVNDDLTLPEAPSWSTDKRSAVTRVDVTYYADIEVDISGFIEDFDSNPGAQFPPAPTGLVESIEVELQFQFVDNPNLGLSNTYDLDAQGFRFVGSGNPESTEDVSRQQKVIKDLEVLTRHLQIPFGAGAQTLRTVHRRPAPVIESIAPGDLRILDIDELPDPATNERGGPVLARCLERVEDGPRIEATWLALTSTTQAVAGGTPTVQCHPDLEGLVLITNITLNASGDPVGIYYAVTDAGTATRPAEDSPKWTLSHRLTSSGDTVVPTKAAGRRVWWRFRSEPDGVSSRNIASDWYFPDPGWTECGNVDVANNCTAVAGRCLDFVLTWENSSNEKPIAILVAPQGETLIEVTNTPLPAGSTFYRVTHYREPETGTPYIIRAELQPATTYDWEVRYYDGPLLAAAACSGTYTTPADPPEAPKPFGLELLVGSEVE